MLCFICQYLNKHDNKWHAMLMKLSSWVTSNATLRVGSYNVTHHHMGFWRKKFCCCDFWCVDFWVVTSTELLSYVSRLWFLLTQQFLPLEPCKRYVLVSLSPHTVICISYIGRCVTYICIRPTSSDLHLVVQLSLQTTILTPMQKLCSTMSNTTCHLGQLASFLIARM